MRSICSRTSVGRSISKALMKSPGNGIPADIVRDRVSKGRSQKAMPCRPPLPATPAKGFIPWLALLKASVIIRVQFSTICEVSPAGSIFPRPSAMEK